MGSGSDETMSSFLLSIWRYDLSVSFQFQTKFHNALETSQRVVKEIAEKDITNINKLMKSADNIHLSLNSTSSVAEFIKQICDEYSLVDVVNNDVIQNDIAYIKQTGIARYQAIGGTHFDIPSWLGGETVRIIERKLAIEGNDERSDNHDYHDSSEDHDSSEGSEEKYEDKKEEKYNKNTDKTPIMLTIFKACYDSNSTIINIGPENGKNAIITTNHPLLISTTVFEYTSDSTTPSVVNLTDSNITITTNSSIAQTTQITGFVPPTLRPIEDNLPKETVNCLTLFDDTEDYRRFGEEWAYEHIYKLQTGREEFLKRIEPVFANATKTLHSQPQIIRCLTSLDKLKNMSVIFEESFDTMKKLSESGNIGEALPILQTLYDYYIILLDLKSNFTGYTQDVESGQSCRWLLNIGHDDYEDFEEIGEDVEAALDHEILAGNSLNDIETAYFKLGDIYVEDVYPTLYLTQQYLKREVNKSELVIAFQRPYFLKAVEDLATFAAEMTAYRRDFKNSWETLSFKLASKFEELTKLKLPILNKETVHHLSFVDMAKHTNNPAFNKIIASFDVDIEKGIGELLRRNYDNIYHTSFAAIEQL